MSSGDRPTGQNLNNVQQPGRENWSAAIVLRDHIKFQKELCSKLEEIADRLPDNIDAQECLHVARCICPVLKEAHQFEEQVLFPILRNYPVDQKDIPQTLEKLQYENWEDESYGGEIREGLISFATDRNSVNAESLGYMLRGFFVGLRRHVDFEKQFFLPLLLNR